MLNSDPGEMFSFILINLVGSRGKVKLEIQNKGHAVTWGKSSCLAETFSKSMDMIGIYTHWNTAKKLFKKNP